MRVLLIDGEYLKHHTIMEKDLNMGLNRIFGMFLPHKIIYYSANMSSEIIEFLKKDIPTIEINNRGWVDSNKHQKGTDGYINVDLVKFGLDKDVKEIYLFAGDGDFIAGVQEYARLKKDRVNLLCWKDSTSDHLKSECIVYNLPSFKEEKKIEPLSNKLLGFLAQLKGVFKKEQKDILNLNFIGSRLQEKGYHIKKCVGMKPLQALEMLQNHGKVKIKLNKSSVDITLCK